MWESAEIGHRLSKPEWKAAVARVRPALLAAQYRLLADPRRAVVILVNGVDGAGRGETVNLLNEWMDPRHIRTEAFGDLTEADRQRPDMWRYWQVLPPKGHIGVLFGSWYSEPLQARVMGDDSHDRFLHRLERIRQFEQMLVAEGVVLIKWWFHLSKQAAKSRMKALQADPRTAWRVTPQERDHLRQHDVWMRVAEEALRTTSWPQAPWQVIDGQDPAYRSIAAADDLLRHLEQARAPMASTVPPAVPPRSGAPAPGGPPRRRGLHAVPIADESRRLRRKAYDEALESLQGRLALLSRDPRMRHRSLVVVFEGMDAAGKGSTIRRITHALDARFYRVVPIGAPNENERAQPYLWRFWRYIPSHGKAVIFDRSWYGRVLVERVEGYCTEADWARAYDEINTYETELAESGAMVVKFWLAITPDEQLRRFREREATPHKHYKITPDDWRNRDKWPLYAHAVDEMIDRTSTAVSPWHVVASDDKYWSRIEVLRQLCERVEEALGHPATSARGKA